MMTPNYWREADFEYTLKDGRVVQGTVKGRLLPPEKHIGAEIADLTIKARCYANLLDADGVEVTMDDLADEWNDLERFAIDALCEDYV